MSIQSAKENFVKNLKENRLIITKEDESKANLLSNKINSIKKHLKDLSLHNSYMESQAFFEDRHYTQLNLFTWAIIVLASLFVFHYFCLTDEGKPMEVIKVLTEPGYTKMLAPFIAQGVLLFLSTFLGLFPVAQFIFTVICLFSYFVLELEFFGSPVNVYYLSLIGGTVITVLARIIEYFAKKRKSLKRAKSGKVYLPKLEKELDEAENIYLSAADKAPEITDFWYSHSYTLPEKEREKFIASGENINVGETQYNYNDKRASDDTVKTYQSLVFDQILEVRPLTANATEQIIDKYKLYPLFGLGIKDFSPEYKYECLYHTWKEEVYERSERQYTEYIAIENKEKTELKSDLESLENKYLGHSADWYELTHPNASSKAVYAVDDYREKKKAMLDEIPDNFYLEENKYDVNSKSHRHYYEFFVYIKVTSPEGELLGIYVTENLNAVKIALKILNKETNLSPNALSIPYSPVQRYYMERYVFPE